MHANGLVGALAPVFFVLLLGYAAGKRNEFDVDQSAGLSKLALNFALPASLFVSMTSIPRDLLLKQGRLLLATPSKSILRPRHRLSSFSLHPRRSRRVYRPP